MGNGWIWKRLNYSTNKLNIELKAIEKLRMYLSRIKEEEIKTDVTQ